MTPLISLDDVKSGLPIRPGTTSFDTTLTAIIASVTSQISTACRRVFEKQEHSEIFHVQVGAKQVYDLYGFSDDGFFYRPDGLPFLLTNRPIDANLPVTVRFDPRHVFGDDTIIPSDEVTLLPEKNFVFVNRALSRSRDSVKITYTAGYEVAGGSLSGSLPEDIKLAAKLQSVFLFKKTDYANVGSSGDTAEDGQSGKEWATQSGLLPEVQSLLIPYRRLLRGRE